MAAAVAVVARELALVDPEAGPEQFSAGITAANGTWLRVRDSRVRLSLGLLDRVAGDAVLHREFEDAWFVRKAGALTLSDSAESWTPRRLAWVLPPYRRAFTDLDA
ncbi:hypothetical protein KGQ20_16050 [Catenulispora sp. NF23]|uniref:Uncharacterized protein n=1 Tax=Catenulispora pinistramenti TaxID=2705254 RepID=A0ABS5KM45_9ACTN|nr:SitI3 family protein [Catenulispora pinistramenti]MBS2534284.1 hypothetical protein [Catenulispora pinistramenti]MBS2547091.1 hypothetical protein [Catenulispora pinistramenti]